jgi:hypothetical protein
VFSAPVVTAPFGSRERAMLEVLYAQGPAGLGAGEPTPRREQSPGVVRRVGEGNRERLIPLGGEVVHARRQFTRGGAPRSEPRQSPERIRRSRRARRSHDAQRFLAHHQVLRAQGWHRQTPRAAPPAPCLRHAPTQSRRRPARGADVGRAQFYFDHADLHAHCAPEPQGTIGEATIRAVRRAACSRGGLFSIGPARRRRGQVEPATACLASAKIVVALGCSPRLSPTPNCSAGT